MSGEHYLNLMGKHQNNSFQVSNLLSNLPILREEKGSYEEQVHLIFCAVKLSDTPSALIHNMPVPMWVSSKNNGEKQPRVS